MLVEQPEVTELTLDDFRGGHDVGDVLCDAVAVDALRVAARAVVGQALGHDLEESGALRDLCELVVEDQGWVVCHDSVDLGIDVSGWLKPKLEWELDAGYFSAVSLVFGKFRQAKRVRSRIVVKENELDSLLSTLIRVKIDTRAVVVLKEVPAGHSLKAHVCKVVNRAHVGAWELHRKRGRETN